MSIKIRGSLKSNNDEQKSLVSESSYEVKAVSRPGRNEYFRFSAKRAGSYFTPRSLHENKQSGLSMRESVGILSSSVAIANNSNAPKNSHRVVNLDLSVEGLSMIDERQVTPNKRHGK